MTPLAWRLLRNPAFRNTRLESATCFECSRAIGVINQIQQELFDGKHLAMPDITREGVIERPTYMLNHGGFMVPPTDLFWLEFKIPGASEGILCHHVEDEIGFTALELQNTGKLKHLTGIVHINNSEEVFISTDARVETTETDLLAHYATFVIAFMVAINSPKAIKISEGARHLGRDRWLKKQKTFSGFKPWHIIDIKGTYVEKGVKKLGYRKALHFVRAHRRCLGVGHFSVVRAHWRGDAKLGICRGSYRVALDKPKNVFNVLNS